MEGNVFSSVCLSVILSTEEGGSHVTITHGALDLTIQGPTGPCPDPHPTEGPPHTRPHCTQIRLLRDVQTCSL